MNISDNAYFCVQSWMVTKLNLRSVERDVFAIIYGYSQDGESDYHGSLQYLADLTGYSRNSVCTALKNLTEKQLLKKTEQEINNIKFCRYTVNLYTVQTACTPVQTACTNNIVNNKKNNNVVSKDTKTNFQFGRPKVKKNNLFDKCLAEIKDYTNDLELQDILVTYLKMRLDMNGKPLYVNQWKGMLNKIDDCISNSPKGTTHKDIIQLAIDRGWASFYPVNNYSNKKSFSENIEQDENNKDTKYNMSNEDYAKKIEKTRAKDAKGNYIVY
jgi:hypothetical protein